MFARNHVKHQKFKCLMLTVPGLGERICEKKPQDFFLLGLSGEFFSQLLVVHNIPYIRTT